MIRLKKILQNVRDYEVGAVHVVGTFYDANPKTAEKLWKGACEEATPDLMREFAIARRRNGGVVYVQIGTRSINPWGKKEPPRIELKVYDHLTAPVAVIKATDLHKG